MKGYIKQQKVNVLPRIIDIKVVLHLTFECVVKIKKH